MKGLNYPQLNKALTLHVQTMHLLLSSWRGAGLLLLQQWWLQWWQSLEATSEPGHGGGAQELPASRLSCGNSRAWKLPGHGCSGAQELL